MHNDRSFAALVVLACGLTAAPLTGCGDHAGAGPGKASQAAPADPVPVTLEPVRRLAVERSIDVTGTLYGDEEVEVAAKLSGRVLGVFGDVGDTVRPGEPLAQVEQRDYELALAERRAAVEATLAQLGLTELPGDGFDPATVPTVRRARAAAANARAKYDRAEQLRGAAGGAGPALSEQEFADIRTAWEVAERDAEVAVLTARATLAQARTLAAEAAVARQRLEDATVRAPGEPADGLVYEVAERLVSPGEYVAVGQALFRLVDSDPIKFRAEAPERFIGQVRVGQSVRVAVDAFPEPWAGRVARISPRVDPQSRAFMVEVEIPSPDGRLKPGSFARGAVATRVDEGAAFVPEAAVVTFAGVQRVFSVKDGRAVEHRVETGVRRDGLVEITGDLPAEAVVTTGAAGLAAGSPVSVR